jgi:LPXTG-site transpeptidase (sortase) family protein
LDHADPQRIEDTGTLKLMTSTKQTPDRRGWLRAAQWTALAVGVALVGWYLIDRTNAQRTSARAVEEFRAQRVIHVGGDLLEPTGDRLDSKRPVDTSLWAEARITAYQESLFSDQRAPLGILRIPELEIEVPVYSGTDDWVLDRGAGHIEGTATPGAAGNAGIASHRDGFFRPLKDIENGDLLIYESLAGETVYRVEGLKIVDPTDVSVLDPASETVLTLVTCYPFYFVGDAPQRFIVRAVADRESGR